MFTLGELYRYAKYLVENDKELNITIGDTLVTVQVNDGKLYVPQPGEDTYLVIDHPNRKLSLADSKQEIQAETVISNDFLQELVDEFRKHFMVYESVLPNAGFALYGSLSDHEEGLE